MELIELQKRNRHDLSPDGEPIVYELISGHYLQVHYAGRGAPDWTEKERYTPNNGDAILEDYPNGVKVVGVGYFESREHFLQVMERNFAVEIVSSVSE